MSDTIIDVHIPYPQFANAVHTSITNTTYMLVVKQYIMLSFHTIAIDDAMLSGVAICNVILSCMVIDNAIFIVYQYTMLSYLFSNIQCVFV